MKKNILTVAALVVFAGMQAQIQTNNGVTNGITNSNVLLDGSSGFSTEAGAGPYVGKGVVIPSVDLVNFQFDLSQADGFTFPTYFDGMIVYNNATGNTLTTGNRPSTSLAVTPGFYYFYNPNGASNGNITGGQWKALGGTATGDNLGNHSATQTLALNGFDLRLKGAADGNQALAYNATIDGPRLWGNVGGALGTINGTNALTWDNSGNVTSPGAIKSGRNGGYIALNPGSTNSAGFLSIYNSSGNRLGYIGSNDTQLVYSAENGANHYFNGDIYSGVNNSLRMRGTGSVYWEDYGGGLYMNDINWLRVSNNKGLYADGAGWFNSYLRVGNPFASQGYVQLNPGSTNSSGFLSIYNSSGNRLGYIGSNDTQLVYTAENGANHFFNGDIYSGVDNSIRMRGTGSVYWQTYGGGWYMQDNDWVRVTNNKGIYTAGVGRFDTRVETARVQGTSDRRFKKDITPIYNATEKLNQLNGYTYTWRDRKEFPGQALGEGKDMGVIAQEVEKVFPDAVMTNKDGYKSVNYNALIPVLIEALKESNRKIQALEDRLNGSGKTPVSSVQKNDFKPAGNLPGKL
ncbi:tail fiber domain-containing protein [uncultured Chryseobacterium sp.]|uniref:tail fiber domain-containing protein n=1 Tax=uncultured Chryseobacterium sp. TaxID=259322 RepID=UPI00374A4669